MPFVACLSHALIDAGCFQILRYATPPVSIFAFELRHAATPFEGFATAIELFAAAPLSSYFRLSCRNIDKFLRHFISRLPAADAFISPAACFSRLSLADAISFSFSLLRHFSEGADTVIFAFAAFDIRYAFISPLLRFAFLGFSSYADARHTFAMPLMLSFHTLRLLPQIS